MGSNSILICGNIDRDIEGCNVASDEGFDLWNNFRNKFWNNVRSGAG